MRRELVNEWPAITHLFGVKPWELQQLTAPELSAYLEALREQST